MYPFWNIPSFVVVIRVPVESKIVGFPSASNIGRLSFSDTRTFAPDAVVK